MRVGVVVVLLGRTQLSRGVEGGGATVEGLKKDEDAAVEGVGESEDAAVAGKEGVR